MTTAGTLAQLRASFPFLYLASPYSKFPDGLDAAHAEVCRIAGWLIRQSVPVYCPIAHTHCVASHGGIDPTDHGIWMEADRPFMEAAHGLLIAEMKGWRDSEGIDEEAAYFTAAGKPVWAINPRGMEIRECS